MNSDPYDSAAWRSFGMLDDDENERFADAMGQDPGLRRACQEMDRLAAAIAATSCAPVVPQAADIEQLKRSAGLPHAGRKAPLWLAACGWILALGLAAWTIRGALVSPAEPPRIAEPSPPPSRPAAPPRDTTEPSVEIRRLSMEIGELRENLEAFQQRERELYQIVPGRALQVVMTMLPPGQTSADRPSLVTPAMLGDALAAMNRHAPAVTEEPIGETQLLETAIDHEAPPLSPMAVPIYDPVRDTGTLVVSDLLPAEPEHAYHLWVTTGHSTQPVFIGSLPESSATGTDTFDFSLGSSMILPTGFLLTYGPAGKPAAPAAENTVLAGPPPAR
jgi:hypothetical protein